MPIGSRLVCRSAPDGTYHSRTTTIAKPIHFVRAAIEPEDGEGSCTATDGAGAISSRVVRSLHRIWEAHSLYVVLAVARCALAET